jgi:C1A family cysteine protease
MPGKKSILLGVFFVLFFMVVGLLYGQLPGSFDWRDYGKVTSVKNQAGDTGWAYATIGSYEGAILVDNGPSENLSEQFLVDSLGGPYNYLSGDWGFAFMISGTPRENSYSGDPDDVPDCFRCYPISSWSYVGDSGSVPRTNDLKQAIYDYGPVCAGVYVSSAFQNYTSGVFKDTGSGAVNHGVVLVGWNDDGGYWILKNSWGTAWGESGYMRIAYTSNQVGYAAAFAKVGEHRCLGMNIWYKFINRYNGYALDVNDGSYYVYNFTYNGGTDKHWNISDVGDGWVKIENCSSGNALDVSGSTNYVYHYPYNGNIDKHWYIYYLGNGYYRVSNRYSGNCLAVGFGPYVYHYPCSPMTGTDHWQIIEVQ